MKARERGDPGIRAKVQTFSQGEIVVEVEWIWFWNGKPERLYCHDGQPEGSRSYYKFKMDEEPFELIGEGTLYGEARSK